MFAVTATVSAHAQERAMLAYLIVALVVVMMVSFCAVVTLALRQWKGLWRWVVGAPVALIIAVVEGAQLPIP
jgi:hypothetical protein